MPILRANTSQSLPESISYLLWATGLAVDNKVSSWLDDYSLLIKLLHKISRPLYLLLYPGNCYFAVDTAYFKKIIPRLQVAYCCPNNSARGIDLPFKQYPSRQISDV